jgi:hypothetical protein
MAIDGIEPPSSAEIVDWLLAWERKRLKELEAYVSQRQSKNKKGKRHLRSLRAKIHEHKIQSLAGARRKAQQDPELRELLKNRAPWSVNEAISRYKRDQKKQK